MSDGYAAPGSAALLLLLSLTGHYEDSDPAIHDTAGNSNLLVPRLCLGTHTARLCLACVLHTSSRCTRQSLCKCVPRQSLGTSGLESASSIMNCRAYFRRPYLDKLMKLRFWGTHLAGRASDGKSGNRMTENNSGNTKSYNDRYEFDLGIDEKEDVLSDESIKEPYDPSRIQVDPHTMTIFQVMRKINFQEINLQPDFQRNIVWDVIRQSRLIESVLIRIPLPAFYLDAKDNNEWLVVDGLQRLWTLHRFFNTKELRLTNLEFLGNQLNGKSFDELPRNFQRDIEETHLHLYVIKPDTPVDVKFTIFYRINTGGMVLSAQEIRHCLFQGKSTMLLKKLAESKAFLEATTGSINTKRMDDRECVLRYCAFHLTPFKSYKESDFNKFLSNAMDKINKMSDKEIAQLKKAFYNSMVLSKSVFGKYAFRKMFSKEGPRNPINKSLFETWSICLERYDKKRVLEKKDKIIDGFVETLNRDNEYLQSVTQGTGGAARVRKRFRKTSRIIMEALE